MKYTNELEKSLNDYFAWNKARMNCFAKMLLALFAVSSINFKKMAVAFDSKARLDSKHKRIKRFFAFFNLDFGEVSKWLLNQFYDGDKKIFLVIDRTNWFFGKAKINILTLGIAHEGAAIQICWTLLNKAGNATGLEHIGIVNRFVELFGKGCIEGVLADREFANSTFIKWLVEAEIPFYIRVKEGSQVKFFCGKTFAVKKLFSDLQNKQQKSYIQPVIICGEKLFVAAGRSERGELLIVATNSKANSQDKSAVSKYLRRWEIENLFQSLKGRGFCFEETHVTKLCRIEKLMALLAVGFCWAHRVGEWRALKKPITFNKYRSSYRPQNSYFRYGLDIIREIVLHIYRKKAEFKSCLKLLFSPPNLVMKAMLEEKI